MTSLLKNKDTKLDFNAITHLHSRKLNAVTSMKAQRAMRLKFGVTTW